MSRKVQKTKMVLLSHIVGDEAPLLIETEGGRNVFHLSPDQLRLLHQMSAVVLQAAGLPFKLSMALVEKEKDGK